MDDEHTPQPPHTRERQGPPRRGVLCERHGISITDAVILLAAMTDARGTTATALATQIIDATVDPGSHPRPVLAAVRASQLPSTAAAQRFLPLHDMQRARSR